MIDAFSVGPVIVIVVGMLLSIAQISLFRIAPEQRWRVWAAGVSADSILFSLAILIQQNTSMAAWLSAAERLELSAVALIPLLTHGLATRLWKRDHPKRFRILVIATCFVAAGIWVIPGTLTGAISERSFRWLSQPYTEATVGWYGIFTLFFTGLVGFLVILDAFLMVPEGQILYKRIVYYAVIWFLTGIHDIVAKLSSFGLPYVTEYGWLFFSFSLLAVMIREQAVLMKSVEKAQKNTQEILDATPNPTAVFRADGRVSFSNPVFRDLFGPPVATIGELAECVADSSGRERFLSTVSTAFLTKNTHLGEFVVRDHRQEDHTMALDIRPLTGDQTESPLRILTFTDISRIRENESSIRRLAEHDHLTGLPNRWLLERTTNELLAGEARRDDPIHHALFFLDLDSFKPVNDSLGHSVGDALLKLVGDRIENRIRESDDLFRFGGDEFVLLARNLRGAENAAEIAASIQELFRCSFTIDATDVAVGISVGIAVYPEDGNDYETLLRKADHAMYHAKQHQSGFQFFSEERHGLAIQTMELTRDLRNAVQQRQTELYYQPIIDRSKQSVVGFEALCRWNHKVHGMIPPSRCIPIAENIGLIHDMTIDHIATILQAIPEIDRAYSGYPFVSANVSPVSLHNSFFEDKLERVVAESSTDISRVVLEITESSRLQDTSETLDRISRIRNMGFRVSLDDFGAGCASLAILEKIPLDFLKLDRSFLSNERDVEQRMKIIEILLSLKNVYDIPQAVVEGVEEENQILSVPASISNVLLQGYLYGRPQPLATVLAGTGRRDG